MTSSCVALAIFIEDRTIISYILYRTGYHTFWTLICIISCRISHWLNAIKGIICVFRASKVYIFAVLDHQFYSWYGIYSRNSYLLIAFLIKEWWYKAIRIRSHTDINILNEMISVAGIEYLAIVAQNNGCIFFISCLVYLFFTHLFDLSVYHRFFCRLV